MIAGTLWGYSYLLHTCSLVVSVGYVSDFGQLHAEVAMINLSME